MLKREQIDVEGLTREYLIYIPAVPAGKPLPVIISLHGTLGSAEQMMNFADFRPIAEREQFLVVCPEGITQTWNDGRATRAHLKGIDDVGFISSLITHLIRAYSADADRVYITGMSNGGFMSSRIACEMPDCISAMAAVAATLDKASTVRPQKALPVMYIHGSKDRMVPYSGGSTKVAGGDVYGHEEVLKLWAEINGCEQEPITSLLPDKANDGTSVIKNEYVTPTTAGAKVVGYTIVNGGHTWPCGPQYAPKNFVGLVSHNLNACGEIWKFFKQYSRGSAF